MTSPESPAGAAAPTAGLKNARPSWRWPVATVASLLIVVGASVYVAKSCRDLPGEALDKTVRVVATAGRQLQDVAAAFKQGTITTTFTSYATEISGSQYLQFASVSQQETFTRKDESSMFWGYIPLPDVIVEATAPVTYTYYLDLNAPWKFLLQDGVIYVTAPDIRFNKPAVDPSRISYEVRKDSHFRNTKEALENLKQSITLLSYKKARANIELVRETGRKETETFVQNWLARSFTDGKRYRVKVRFRDESSRAQPDVQPHDLEPAAK
jgi:hypothetical protein